MKMLTDVLYAIANSLLAPVILCLLLLLGWTLLLLGRFLREALQRRRVRQQIEALVASARNEWKIGNATWRQARESATGILRHWLSFIGEDFDDSAILAQGLSTIENDIADSVARLSFITRVSPMLGLMGTLIPLGPALSSLANGNMQALAGNLIVAFTATVVGLLISGMAYGISVTRRCWYMRDLSDLEFVVKQLARQREPVLCEGEMEHAVG